LAARFRETPLPREGSHESSRRAPGSRSPCGRRRLAEAAERVLREAVRRAETARPGREDAQVEVRDAGGHLLRGGLGRRREPVPAALSWQDREVRAQGKASPGKPGGGPEQGC